MTNMIKWKFFAISILSVLLAGCSLVSSNKPILIAVKSEAPVILNGAMDDPVWNYCPRYSLYQPLDNQTDHFQAGFIRLAYDEQYFYLLAELKDDDIVQYGENHTNLWEAGDVIELFLWPESDMHYWEFQAAPNGAYLALAYPSPGRRILPQVIRSNLVLPLGISLQGTLNDYRDTDHEWIIELAIPMDELLRHGNKLTDNWRILISRYNYSKSLETIQYSVAVPHLPVTDFHRRNYYAYLKFEEK